MLAFLRGRASERKLRLFAAACCRRIWHYLSEDVARPGVEVVERYADQRATASELADAHRAARAQGREFERLCQWRRNTRGPSPEADLYQRESEQAHLVAYASQSNDYLGAVLIHTTMCKLRFSGFIRPVTDQPSGDEWNRLCDADRAELAELLRDICGNPFRPFVFGPTSRTSAAVAPARSMYESRDFSSAPALADYLEAAGCDDAQVLGHLRVGGGHVRGCHVVDAVLGLS